MRQAELATFLDALRAWALREGWRAWLAMSIEDIRGSWLAVRPQMLAVHERAVIEALRATDDYMTLVASEAGARYDVTWHDDRPARPYRLPNGQTVADRLGMAPVMAMTWIKRGHDRHEALTKGGRVAVGLLGTEPHAVSREACRERVLADLRAGE